MSLNSMINVFPNNSTFEATNVLLNRIANALERNSSISTDVTDFNEVRKNVAAGSGAVLYPVGSELINYKAFSASAAAGAENAGVSAASVSFETFIYAIDTIDPNVKIFTYFDGIWYYKGNIVNLTDYGISITGTPFNGDVVSVTLTCAKIVWVVRAHDHFNTQGELAHTMCIEMKDVYGTNAAYKGVVFDAPEAFYVHEDATALAAGDYTFNVPTTYSSWTAGDYTFTTTAAHPKGAQFCISGYAGTALTSLKVQIYDGGFGDNTVAEECVISSGSTGTSLGTFGTELNNVQRVSYGSNNYAQSNIRQWLNSEAVQGSVLAQQTKFDRRASWDTGSDAAFAGFLHGMDSNFKSALATPILPCRTNSVYEIASLNGTTFAVDSIYELRDKVFLLSRPEIYNSWDSTSIKDGTVLTYYEGLTDLERSKYDQFGTVHFAWLRSPYPTSANGERNVNNSTGAVSYNYAYGAYGAAAACVIG